MLQLVETTERRCRWQKDEHSGCLGPLQLSWLLDGLEYRLPDSAPSSAWFADPFPMLCTIWYKRYGW